MRSQIVTLAILTLINAEVCYKSIRTPYVKSTDKKVHRVTTCYYKCWRSHQTQVNTDYWTIDNCVVDYTTSVRPVCCAGYTGLASRCLPSCYGCTNGRCTAPNVCSCNEGYRNELGFCVPVCDPECGHGTCEAPGQCSCHEGYEMDRTGRCVPRCDPPCRKGECVGLDTCECFRGFRKMMESDVCVPECDTQLADCGNGTCIEPNRCSCAEGFIFENHRCIPQCDPTCINGQCTAPKNCICNKGFTQDPLHPNICVPVCTSLCHNGACVAPNTCQCLPGYHQSNTVPNSCEPSCDPKYVDVRDGQCISFNVLQCNKGFELEFSPLSGLVHCSLKIVVN